MPVLAHRTGTLALLAAVALTGAACAQSGASTPALSLTPVAAAQPATGMAHGGGMMHGDREAMRARMLRQIDADGDGQISRAEMDAAHEAMRKRSVAAFDAADANKDGKLSPDEMRAYHQAMRPPGMGPRGPRPDAAVPRPSN